MSGLTRRKLVIAQVNLQFRIIPNLGYICMPLSALSLKGIVLQYVFHYIDNLHHY